MDNLIDDAERHSAPLNNVRNTATPQAPDAKALLIDIAEHLYGQHGLDAVSFREITVAAGKLNQGVVQYHFKDKDGLINAILKERFRHLNALVSERLQKSSSELLSDARELLDIFWSSILHIRSLDGSRAFCRFLLQYSLYPYNAKNPLSKLYNAPNDLGAESNDYSSLLRLFLGLKRCMSPPVPLFRRRLCAVGVMFLAAVIEYDNMALLLQSEGKLLDPFLLEPLLDIAIAALEAPH